MVNFVDKVERNYLDKPGKYKVRISKVEEFKTKSLTGIYQMFSFETENQECYNVRANSMNNSDKAVEIGYGVFLKILRANNQDKLVDLCKNLEPMASDYNELWRLIKVNGIIERINLGQELILELYYKKPKVIFNSLTSREEEIVELGEKFFPLTDEKLDDSVPF